MHLFSTNGDGDYLDSSNNVVTSVSAWWNRFNSLNILKLNNLN